MMVFIALRSFNEISGHFLIVFAVVFVILFAFFLSHGAYVRQKRKKLENQLDGDEEDE